MIHVSNEACDTGGERYTPLAGSQGNLRDFIEIIVHFQPVLMSIQPRLRPAAEIILGNRYQITAAPPNRPPMRISKPITGDHCLFSQEQILDDTRQACQSVSRRGQPVKKATLAIDAAISGPQDAASSAPPQKNR